MKWVYKIWWNRNIPPLLWRRAIIQHSVSWRWIGRGVSIHKFQVIFACAESSRSSQDWMGSPVAFFLFHIPKQGYMKFNSWWAAYNSSSLGANVTGGSDFPLRNKTGHLQQSIKMDKSFFSPPSDYVQYVSFQDSHPHHSCSFTSLNLEVIWRRPTSRKENSIQKWRKLEGIQYTPRASQYPCYSTIQCTATVRTQILAAWMSSFFLILWCIKGTK